MKIAYGLMSEGNPVKWFDTWAETATANDSAGFPWRNCILVYAMSEKICEINYNPHMGYFITGFIEETETGLVDRMAKHGISGEMIFGKAAVS